MNTTTTSTSRTLPSSVSPRVIAAAGACLAIAASALVAGTSTASAATSAPACDSDQYTVTSVVTEHSAATICASYGSTPLEYRGLNRTTGDTLCVPVSEVHRQENGSGRYFYVAYNNGYKYAVFDDLGLSIVGPDGTLISSEPAL